jgi:sarcosine oxidase
MTKVDYVVVGGGITGVCATYHLAKKGADVLLIEREELAPDSPISSSGEHAKAFRSIYGKDRAMTRLCRESFKHWRHFERETEAELFVPSGMFVFGADQSRTLKHWTNPDLARFAVDSASILKEEGLSHELIGKQELVERYPQIVENEFYDHAILDKTAGFICARDAVRKIGSLAEKEGALVWDHTPVEKVVRQGERVEHLVTARGDVMPKKAVIFAAGYMNGDFAPELRVKTRVTQHQILYLKPRDPAPYSPKKMPILIDINQWRYVFPIHGPGITKVVDDDNDSNEKVIDPKQRFDVGKDERFRADAMSFLKKYIPGLVDSEEVERSTCRYTNTVGQKYLIYRRENAVVISACSGHGFKNAPMTASMAVALAENQAQVPPYLDRDFAYENAKNFDII